MISPYIKEAFKNRFDFVDVYVKDGWYIGFFRDYTSKGKTIKDEGRRIAKVADCWIKVESHGGRTVYVRDHKVFGFGPK